MLMPRIGKRHVKMGKRASKVHIAIAKKSKTMTNSLRLNGFCHNIICFHQLSPQEFKDNFPTPAASNRMGYFKYFNPLDKNAENTTCQIKIIYSSIVFKHQVF
jgi:hypothetical protein